MALPDNRASLTPVVRPFLGPDGRALDDALVSYERGGIALNDPSQGMDVRTWKVFADDQGIWIQSRQVDTPILFIQGEEINYVDLAFDNNMNPVICYRQLEVVKLSWFDPQTSVRITTEYPMAHVGCVTLDDKRPGFTSTNDVLFIYARDEGIYYRQQRDRYGVEYYLGPVPPEFVNVVPAYCEEDYCEVDYTGMSVYGLAPLLLLNAGMTDALRIQIEIAV